MRRSSSSAGTSTFAAEPRAAGLEFTDEALVVRLVDGRSLSVPLAWLPRLKGASETERRNFVLLDDGEEIRWPTLDEDVSVPGLLGLPD